MKTKKLLLTYILALMASLVAGAQEFPEIWDDSSYDVQQGTKGFMRIVNYGGASTPWENKAFIYATVVNNSGIFSKKDLFRLTCSGVHTFNSPYSGYQVKVNFANQGSQQGGITGLSNKLYLFGKNELLLGIQDQNSLVQINSSKVTLGRDLRTDHDGVMMQFGNTVNNQQGWFGSLTRTNISFGANAASAVIVDTLRNMYVGVPIDDFSQISSTLKNTYKLFVRGGVLSEDFAIAPIASWSDFVFAPQYCLKPLSEVEEYIEEHKHLPDVPSEKDVAEQGYSQHEINKILLQKIEELTLYTIEQQKLIDELQKKLKEEK